MVRGTDRCLAELLVRFREPTSGRTTLAGLDLAAAAALLVIAHERGLEAFDTVLSLREGRISAQARR